MCVPNARKLGDPSWLFAFANRSPSTRSISELARIYGQVVALRSQVATIPSDGQEYPPDPVRTPTTARTM